MRTLNIVEKARAFAALAHKCQMYGNRPYLYHLDHVAQVAERFGHGEWPLVMVSCYLHDVIEDTNVTKEELADHFGHTTADVVSFVSDVGGKDKEFLFKNYTGKDRVATLVKYCDRVANVEACLAENKTEILNKYISEQPLFERYLTNDGFDKDIQRYLKELIRMAKVYVGDLI